MDHTTQVPGDFPISQIVIAVDRLLAKNNATDGIRSVPRYLIDHIITTSSAGDSCTQTMDPVVRSWPACWLASLLLQSEAEPATSSNWDGIAKLKPSLLVLRSY